MPYTVTQMKSPISYLDFYKYFRIRNVCPCSCWTKVPFQTIIYDPLRNGYHPRESAWASLWHYHQLISCSYATSVHIRRHRVMRSDTKRVLLLYLIFRYLKNLNAIREVSRFYTMTCFHPKLTNPTYWNNQERLISPVYPTAHVK